MKSPPTVFRLTQSSLKVRPCIVSFFLEPLRMLLVVVAIFWTKIQQDPRALFAAAQIVVTGEGSSSPFVVQAEPNTSGDVLDRERRMMYRSSTRAAFVHGCCFWAIVEMNLVRSDTERVEEDSREGDEVAHTSGRSFKICR